MKKIIELKLKFLSRLIIKKYQPKIVGVTGSVGKTSTKEAIYTVLKKDYNVRQNIKNYNNEIGVPLTIIGRESGGRNIFKWILVFLYAAKLIFLKDKNYPKILVLEMGVDHPGDMDYLLKIVKPDIGVVTMIGTVHVEHFGTQSKLRKEKAKLIQAVKKNGWSIINQDNIESEKIIKDSKAKVLTFGLEEKSKIQAKDIKFSFGVSGDAKKIQGISFKMSYLGSVAPVFLPKALSKPNVYSALAASAVGLALDMNLISVAEALRKYKSPRARMSLIEGLKKTTIIDDTYNAEPESMSAAIDVLFKMPIEEGKKRFAVLGDMLELGKYSAQKHKEIGEKLGKLGVDMLIAVGERSKDFGRGAESSGMKSENISYFSNSEEAGRFLEKKMKQGDIILVKGSQGLRMEKIVKEVMAEPLQAKELLVRQEEGWV